jgi:hypothetical protein
MRDPLVDLIRKSTGDMGAYVLASDSELPEADIPVSHQRRAGAGPDVVEYEFRAQRAAARSKTLRFA